MGSGILRISTPVGPFSNLDAPRRRGFSWRMSTYASHCCKESCLCALPWQRLHQQRATGQQGNKGGLGLANTMGMEEWMASWQRLVVDSS